MCLMLTKYMFNRLILLRSVCNFDTLFKVITSIKAQKISFRKKQVMKF